MIFKLQTDTGVVQYSAFELVELLMREFSKRDRDDLGELALTLSMFLQRSEVLHTSTPFNLVHLGVMLGYYYAQVFRNHKIEVVDATTDV